MFRKLLIAVASLTLAGQVHAGAVPATPVIESGTGVIGFEDLGGGFYELFSDGPLDVAGGSDTADIFVEVEETSAGQFDLGLTAYSASRLLPPGSFPRGLSDEYELEDFMASGTMFSAVLKFDSLFGIDERGILSDGAKLIVTSGDFAFTDGGLSEVFSFFAGNAANQSFYDVSFAIYAPVSAVPLPAGVVLLMTGMGGIMVLRRRKAA